MVDSGAVAVVKGEGEGFRGGIEVNGTHGVHALGPYFLDDVTVERPFARSLSTVVVARWCLHTHGAFFVGGEFAIVERTGAHINVIIACESQIHAEFIEQFAPSGVLRGLAVVAENHW